MAKNQNKYTPEFKQQIVDLYATGNHSIPQLENEYGVARSTISMGFYLSANPSRTRSDSSYRLCPGKFFLYFQHFIASFNDFPGLSSK